MRWQLSNSARAYVEATLRETAGLQARIAELEAAARDLADAWERRVETADKDERIAALEAAARAVVEAANAYEWQGFPMCFACRSFAVSHNDTCPVGALAALLEDT